MAVKRARRQGIERGIGRAYRSRCRSSSKGVVATVVAVTSVLVAVCCCLKTCIGHNIGLQAPISMRNMGTEEHGTQREGGSVAWPCEVDVSEELC